MIETKAISDLFVSAKAGTVNVKPNALRLRKDKQVYTAESLEKLQDAIASLGNAGAAMLSLISQTMSAPLYIDRGDATGPDLDDTTAIIDGDWQDWSLSGVIPNGTKAVLIHATVYNDTSFIYMMLRKKGNVAAFNVGSIFADSSVPSSCDLWVSCDPSRVVQYVGIDSGGDNWIQLTVGGWLI